MVKHTTLLAAALLAVGTAFGQITLTNAYFPMAGDSLIYGVANEGFTIDQLTPGADLQWDFGAQVAVDTQVQVIMPNEDGSPFPEAEAIVALDDENTGYFNITDEVYELIGIRGSAGELFANFEFDAEVDPGRAERRAPLNYQDGFIDTTVNQLVISPDSLPEEARQDFQLLLTGVDSIRLTTISARTDTVDAYGALSINGQSYEVLRERRTEQITTTIETKTGNDQFRDRTDQVLAFEPDASDFLGPQDPVINYYYWTETENEAVAIVTVDSTEVPTDLRFIQADSVNSIGNQPILTRGQIKVYPNPARNRTTFTAEGIEMGTYTLQLFNVLGRHISTQQFSPSGGRVQLDLDVSALPRGTYLYRLTNERGHILTTRRLLVGK